MMSMQIKLTPIAAGVLLGIIVSIPQSARADYAQGSVLSDKIFYQIGGGSAVMPPPTRKRPNEYSIGLGWNGDFMCGNFDLKTTVKNQLNGVTEGFKDLFGNIIESATGAVASMPAMIIQRANPQLYDLLTNGLYQAKLDFDSLKTSCEAMANDMADFVFDQKWEKSAEMNNWKEIIGLEPDAKKAKKQIEDDGGKKGIVWIGGEKKGGLNQGSINLLLDVVSAGFNLSQGRGALDKSSVPTTQCDGRMCTEWQTPAQAAEWVRDVLGDKTISTCQDCGDKPKSSKAGTGLASKIEEETIGVMTNFETILNSNDISAEQLQAISSTTIPITRGLIDAIKNDPDAVVLATRLSSEVGVSRTLEKALIARRMILAGMREPNVSQNTLAQDELKHALQDLDREIEQVRLEVDMQKMIGGSTAITALNNRLIEQQRGLTSNAPDSTIGRFGTLEQAEDEDIKENAIYAEERHIILPISNFTGGLSGINATYNTAIMTGSGTSGMVITGGNYAPLNAISGTSLEQATGLLRNFEGFSAKSYWDVNAYRTGYGSDTITTADGTVIKVTKDTIVSKEDAERDLARRTQIFADGVKRQVKAETWNALPPNAQAALTSIAYNYGSLSELPSLVKAAQVSAKTGDMTALAAAIRNRAVDNNGVNAKRRNQEADYVLQKG